MKNNHDPTAANVRKRHSRTHTILDRLRKNYTQKSFENRRNTWGTKHLLNIYNFLKTINTKV